jgi:hypothetical protein
MAALIYYVACTRTTLASFKSVMLQIDQSNSDEHPVIHCLTLCRGSAPDLKSLSLKASLSRSAYLQRTVLPPWIMS